MARGLVEPSAPPATFTPATFLPPPLPSPLPPPPVPGAYPEDAPGSAYAMGSEHVPRLAFETPRANGASAPQHLGTSAPQDNGCMCCTVRGDLLGAFGQIATTVDSGAPLDSVLIETTGMADPVPIVRAAVVERAEKRCADETDSVGSATRASKGRAEDVSRRSGRVPPPWPLGASASASRLLGRPLGRRSERRRRRALAASVRRAGSAPSSPRPRPVLAPSSRALRPPCRPLDVPRPLRCALCCRRPRSPRASL